MVGLTVLSVAAIAVGACRDSPPTVPAQPTAAGVQPLRDAGLVAAPSAIATSPSGQPGAMPTSGALVPASAAQSTPVPPLGHIPAPTIRPTVPVPPEGPPIVDHDIVAMIQRVDQARLSATVRRLEGFGTRHSLSPSDDTDRGVGAAREWLFGELQALNGREGNQVLVEFDDFALSVAGRRTTQRNVLATLPGIGRNKQLIYVTANYDSRASDPDDGEGDAPGANANASGTAALLELARVLGLRKWDATIRLAALAAGEHAAAGSRHHADAARALRLPIAAAIDLDTIGGGRGEGGVALDRQLYLFADQPPDSPSRQLARYAYALGERYSELVVTMATDDASPLSSGDERPFSDAAFAAVRLTGPAHDRSWPRTVDDTSDRLDWQALSAATRLALALVANLALAPPSPSQAPILEPIADQPGALSVWWEPVLGPSVAGYWLAWRRLDSSAYQEQMWVSSGTSAVITLPTPADRVAVAVAAADDLGHTSLFSPEAAR